jgi:hypothetical protein
LLLVDAMPSELVEGHVRMNDCGSARRRCEGWDWLLHARRRLSFLRQLMADARSWVAEQRAASGDCEGEIKFGASFVWAGSYNRDCGTAPQLKLKLNGADADLTIVLTLVTIPLHMLGHHNSLQSAAYIMGRDLPSLSVSSKAGKIPFFAKWNTTFIL